MAVGLLSRAVFDGVRRWVISGGIGSGKTAVRGFLSARGVHTVDADSVGHQVLMPDGPAFEDVAGQWPSVVVDGAIDRSALGEIVFADRTELELLESITHPHIFGRIRAEVEGNQGPVAVEIPILKHGLGPEWARLVVDCVDDVRVARLTQRGLSRGEVLKRMAAQPSRERWLSAADVVVPNHGNLVDLESTVETLGLRL